MAVKSQEEQPAKPPKPPEIDRRLKFFWAQAIGVPIIAILPVLATLQFFDSTPEHIKVSHDGLALEIRSYAKLRYKSSPPMQILVRNETGTELSEIKLSLSADYVDKFREVRFQPEPEYVGADGATIVFQDVPAWESRTVDIYLESHDAGNHKAKAKADADNRTVEAQFSTFVFP